jgi:hypothetical protein
MNVEMRVESIEKVIGLKSLLISLLLIGCMVVVLQSVFAGQQGTKAKIEQEATLIQQHIQGIDP